MKNEEEERLNEEREVVETRFVMLLCNKPSKIMNFILFKLYKSFISSTVLISTSTSSNIEALRKQRLDLDFEVPEETNSDLIAPPLINDEEFNQTSTSSQSVTVCDESVLSETSFLKVAGTIKFKYQVI